MVVLEPYSPDLLWILIVGFLIAFVLAFGLVGRGSTAFLLNVGAAGLTAGASMHMGGYWDEKSSIPFMSGYNDAVRSSKSSRQQLALVGALWACTSFLAIFGLLW